MELSKEQIERWRTTLLAVVAKRAQVGEPAEEINALCNMAVKGIAKMEFLLVTEDGCLLQASGREPTADEKQSEADGLVSLVRFRGNRFEQWDSDVQAWVAVGPVQEAE